MSFFEHTENWFKGEAFDGTVRVKITDPFIKIFDDEWSSGSITDIRDSKYTVFSSAGFWRIKIDLENVTGDIRVIVDDNGQ